MNNHQKKAIRDWDKLLNPNVLKCNLITCSLFIATYEMLRTSVIDHIKGFFTNGFDKNGPTVSQDYQNEVLSLNKSSFIASQLWLKEMTAIDDDDMASIHQIRDHRNALAHDLLKFLTEAEVEININLMAEMYRLVNKIDRWWIREVDIPTNADYDGHEVADDDITSGTMMCIQIMLQTATGEASTALWEKWQMYRTNDMASAVPETSL